MILRVLNYLVLIFLLSACSGPGYYLQAASGQWKLMQARQEVESLLSNPSTPPALAAHLQAAGQIREFAQNELDLPANGNYSSYVEVEGDALLWNVVATEEFSLQPKTWCFLVAGCVPYRGFFKLQKAEDSASYLQNKGMDVYISPAAAFSSLGWFNDPLLSTMFSGSEIRLAAFLFHELAHQRLYLKADGLFNEGYARFVEETGIRAWLISNQRQNELLHWQQLQDANRDFTELIGAVRTELSGVYQSNETVIRKRKLKADIFNSLSNSYVHLSKDKWQGRRYYSDWFEAPLNNAKLALYNTYESSHCAFKDLLDRAGGNLREFHRLAEQKSRLKKDDREKWLKQKCLTIASQDDL